MGKVRTILALSMAVLALSAVAFLPATAMADSSDTSGTVPTTTTPLPATTTTPTPAPKPGRKLIALFRTRAKVRLAAFNADAKLLQRRINRLGVIATRVSAKGGDVTQVRTALAKARADLALAKSQAATAAADLRLVPWPLIAKPRRPTPTLSSRRHAIR